MTTTEIVRKAVEDKEITRRIGVVAIAPDDVDVFTEAMGKGFVDLCEDGIIVSADFTVLVDADALGVEPTMYVGGGIPAVWGEAHGQAICTYSTKIIGTCERTIHGVKFDTEVARVGAVHVDCGGMAFTVTEVR